MNENEIEVLEGMVNNRLNYLRNEAEQGKKLSKEANFNQFWNGKMAQIEGITGEIPFLEKLIAKIQEVKGNVLGEQFG